MAAEAERRQAAVLYAELRNFTRLSEALPPGKVLELANEFFVFCASAVAAHKGKVLSVQNDALLAAFAGASPKDFAERSVNAARDLQRDFGTLGDAWHAQYGLPAALACAVHLGEAVFGMAGPAGARQFVALGDCVSVAERLVHRARAGEVIVSAEVMDALGPVAASLGAQEVPPLQLVKRAPIRLYGIVLETRLDFT
ncbi:MAG: adenylate/guanylate cyclase domain-containing protein [Burkholderiales bacterium]